jgi:RimJ/RimL family protein N-acetyltransferase
MVTVTSTVLAGTRVQLVPFRLENIYQHYSWNNDPELNALDSELPYVAEPFRAFKRRFEQLVRDPAPDGVDLEICAEDGTLIGVAWVGSISAHNRHCLVGVTIGDRNYWGRGYGRDSLDVLLDYCFNVLQMHRVSAETFEYNTAWKRLLEEIGFVKEGVKRDYILREGNFWDKEHYALLESEYRSARV